MSERARETDKALKIRWPVDVLTAIGFHPRDAARLHPLLPEVHVGTISAVLRNVEILRRYPGRYEPAAHVVWAHHNVSIYQATSLAHAGRGLLDVLTVLDAVQNHVHHRVSLEGFDTALEWALERRVPRHRVARYIELGVPPAKAAALEAAPEPPCEAALETLAALRRP